MFVILYIKLTHKIYLMKIAKRVFQFVQSSNIFKHFTIFVWDFFSAETLSLLLQSFKTIFKVDVEINYNTLTQIRAFCQCVWKWEFFGKFQTRYFCPLIVPSFATKFQKNSWSRAGDIKLHVFDPKQVQMISYKYVKVSK